jgi:hypothetical protein
MISYSILTADMEHTWPDKRGAKWQRAAHQTDNASWFVGVS